MARLARTRGGFHRKAYATLMGVLGVGVACLLLGLTPANMFWHALASIFLVGVTVSMIDGPIAAVMQSTVPPETQGRVLGLVMSLSSPATPIGLAVAGPVGDAMGIPFWFKLAGVSDEYRSWCDLRVDSGV